MCSEALFQNHLSPYLCGYRKLEKCLDNEDFGGTILMDLAMTFYILNHGLLCTKLHAYGFGES